MTMLTGVTLIEYMARLAITLNDRLTGSRADVSLIAEALSLAYLSGGIAALTEETQRIRQEAADDRAAEKVAG